MGCFFTCDLLPASRISLKLVKSVTMKNDAHDDAMTESYFPGAGLGVTCYAHKAASVSVHPMH